MQRPDAVEATQPGGLEGVDHAEHERRFGSDDGEIDALAAGEGDETRDVLGGNGDVANLRLAGGAGVARCHQDLGHSG